MTCKVAIIEDDGLIALGMRVVLESAGYEVVGVADTENDAVDLAHRARPDVAVVDVQLREGCGVTAARAFAPATGCAVVFVTSYADLVPEMGPPLPALVAGKPIMPAALVAAVTLATRWVHDGVVPGVLPSGVSALT